ncbi:hypothetical protein ABIC60_004730 [Phyllobacterium ifriqiyense]
MNAMGFGYARGWKPKLSRRPEAEEPPPTLIDKEYPFQVALHCEDVGLHFDRVGFLSKTLGCYRLNRNVYVHPDRYIVYMFAEQRNAECFLKPLTGNG